MDNPEGDSRDTGTQDTGRRQPKQNTHNVCTLHLALNLI